MDRSVYIWGQPSAPLPPDAPLQVIQDAAATKMGPFKMGFVLKNEKI